METVRAYLTSSQQLVEDTAVMLTQLVSKYHAVVKCYRVVEL